MNLAPQASPSPKCFSRTPGNACKLNTFALNRCSLGPGAKKKRALTMKTCQPRAQFSGKIFMYLFPRKTCPTCNTYKPKTFTLKWTPNPIPRTLTLKTCQSRGQFSGKNHVLISRKNGLHLPTNLMPGMVETVAFGLVNQNPILEPKPKTLKPDPD